MNGEGPESDRDETDGSSSAAGPRPKSLWQVMKPDEGAPPQHAPTGTSPEVQDDDSATAMKGLWGVMRGFTSHPAEPLDRDVSPQESEVPLAEAHELSDEDAEEPLDGVAAPAHHSARRTFAAGGRGLASLLLGLSAVALSALTLLPDVWAKFPATAAGFGALVTGYLALSERRRSTEGTPTHILAGAGVALGMLGIFLGPLWIAGSGDVWRQSQARRQTHTNLEQIGLALAAYHGEHGRFPAGGVFAPDGRGGLHGWMSALLPYVGEEPLYRQIDFSKPYIDDVNRPAMSRQVPAYLAAGADPAPTNRGFAVAHFAGLGGNVQVPGLGMARAGIFDRNSAVTQADITSGLSQTLVAGEIVRHFPAWGYPENWRTVGPGLNRPNGGFGNAAGDGALFLKADGSVQFYSNAVTPAVLQKLSLRDAGNVAKEP